MKQRHIAIEGADCAGKDTICELLKEQIPNSEIVIEPGGTPVGQELRALIKQEHTVYFRPGALTLSEHENIMLLFASRSQLCRTLKAKAQAGDTKTYIWNRCFVSSYVYQVLTGGVTKGLFHELMKTVTVLPEAIFIIIPTKEEYLRRAGTRGGENDELGKRSVENYELFKQAYFDCQEMCESYGIKVHYLEPDSPDTEQCLKAITPHIFPSAVTIT